jgi:hypothetical protein
MAIRKKEHYRDPEPQKELDADWKRKRMSGAGEMGTP